MEIVQADQEIWSRLQAETRPIVLYGMGDGADKILRVFAARGIRADGVFASDEFVRGHSFAGFRVERLDEVVARLGEDLVVVLSFASQRPELLARFDELDARFDLVAPDVPVAGDTLFDYAFLQAHREELKRVEGLLADEQSREVLRNVVNFKITGKIAYLRACRSEKEEIFSSVLCPSAEEDFVDLGAYNGDTIRELLSYTGGQYRSITAFEPDRRNFKKLRAYVEEVLDGRAELEQAGAWSRDETLRFAARAGRNSALSAQGTETRMRSVDRVLEGRRCSMLKLDVEGAERQALLGAKETIAAWHPKLNVACYHRSEDLFDLPLLIHELHPGYRLYLRHHPYVPAWDVNLYAVSE